MNLMSFPSLPQVLWYTGPFLFSGPVLLLVSVGMWLIYLRHVFLAVRARLRGQQQEGGQRGGVRVLGVMAAGTLLIGASHFYSVYCETIYTALWWHIEPERIAAVEVERLPAEGEAPVGPPVTISDAAALHDGFRRLDDARSYTRSHESFRDGYRLHIREVGARDFGERYLTVYRLSKRRGAVPLVIPHRGPGDEWTRTEGGEYTSPAFLQWVADVIDPRFAVQGK